MTTTTTPSPGLTRGQVIRAVIFAVVALVFILGGLAIGYAPGLVPHALVAGTAGPVSTGHHPLRVTAAVIVGLVFAVAAGFALRRKGSAHDPANRHPADRHPANRHPADRHPADPNA